MILLSGVLRGFWRAPARLVGVMALVTVATAVFSGTYMALDRLQTATDQLYQRLQLADFLVGISPTDAARVPTEDALRTTETAGLQWRLDTMGMLTLPDGSRAPARVIAVDQRRSPEVSDVSLIEGQWPAEAQQALLDLRFAEDRGLQVGDRVELRVGANRVSLPLSGLMLHPEFLMASVDDRFTMPLRGTVGMLLVTRQQVLLATHSDLINTLAVRLQPGSDSGLALKKIQMLLQQAGVEVVGMQQQSEFYSVYCHWNRLVGFRDFLPTVVGLFDGLAALAALLLVRNATLRARTEIGALLAIGVSPVRIAIAWVGALELLALPALLAGALISLGLAQAVYQAYGDSTGFPLVEGTFPLWPLAAATTVAATLLVPAVLLPLWPLLRRMPAELMRDIPENPGVRLPALLRRLPMPERLGVALLIRRPSRLATVAVCIAGTQVMALSLWVFADGLGAGLERYLSSQHWDAEVDFWPPQSPESLGPLVLMSGASEAEPVVTMPASLGPDDRQMTLVGLSSAMRGSGDVLEGKLPEVSGEVAIPLRAAQAWGRGVGAQIPVRIHGQADMLTISGIVNNYLLNVAYVAPAMLPSAEVTTLLLRKPEHLDELADQAVVLRVLPQAQIGKAATEVLSVLVLFLQAYAAMGGLVGAALLWTTIRVEVQDAEGSYGVLSALGWPAPAVFRVLAVQAGALALVSTALAIPANRISLMIFQERLARINVWVDVSGAGRAEMQQLLPSAILVFISVLPALALIGRLELGRVLGRNT